MTTRDDLLALDTVDPLGGHRGRFDLPEGIYLDGNSLGAQVRRAPEAASAVLDEWRRRLIEGWMEEGWWELPLEFGSRIAHLIGAAPGQVVACDTTTTNLFKVLHSVVAERPDRSVILMRDSAFPTDRYVIEAVAAQTGRTVRVAPIGDAPADHLDDQVAAAVLEHVDFRTAAILDMTATTAAVHESGALAVWDLSHSAGVMPIHLDEDGVDAAVGCTYKYLNGGPGAPAYLYVANRWLERATTPIPGWLGHADPFLMAPGYQPAPGIRRFLTGTQPIISMRMALAALEVYADVDLADVRAKSIRMSDLFIELVDERCSGVGLEVVSPREGAQRGSQVTLRHADAEHLHRRLVEAGVVGDYRTPDLVRFGFAPLTTSYADVWDAVDVMRTVMGA
jgi:kynureninase